MRTHSTRRFTLAIGCVVIVFATLNPLGVAQSPTALPLVQSSNLRYLGSFRLPTNDGSGASTGDLTYGGTALALSSGGGLFLGGHDWSQRLCEVSIPAIGGTATIRQRCVEVTEGRMLQVDSDRPIKLGGSLVWNGRLISTAFTYYDADTSQSKSHFASGTTLSATGDVTGPVQVGNQAGFVSGQMAVIPSEWRSLLGGPAFAGQCCLSIISRTSAGPSVSVFNPDDVGRVTPVPATRVLGYPIDHPLADHTRANPLYTHADVMGGFAFPAGTRSVLFIGRHGTGTPCYGEAAQCGGDPANPYKGFHAYPYYHQVWAYDANDLLAVKNGAKQQWELRPYATWRLTEINNSGTATVAGATYDPTTKRMYITETYGENPKVHIYEVTSGVAAPPPPPGPEICGDGIDNDQDGQIDEGCPQPGPPPPPPGPEICGDGIDNDQDGQIDEGCPAPGPQEICGDGVDNDSDGQVDEGCPGPPQRLEGTVRGNHITLSWLAPITGSTATQYFVEAGVNAGQTLYSFSNNSQTSARINNVGNGRYYVRVRAANSAGKSIPSNEVTISVGCSGAPRQLTNFLTRVRGGLVTMTWKDPDGCNDTSYRVSATDASGRTLGVLSTESTAVTALAGPGTYYLSAAAVSSRGASAPTAPVRLVVNSGECVPPQFATQLTVQVTGALVQLAWNPTNITEALNADAVTPLVYVVEAGTGPGLSNILRVPLGRTTSIAAPAPSGTYYLRVRPADMCGLGTVSNEVIARVP